MSTPRSHAPPAPVRERAACMCATGGRCSTYAPGHALHLIQARLSSATPAEWTDAVVETADASTGVVVARTLEGAAITVWSAAGAAIDLAPGTPVAVHTRYDVLAIGRVRYNVARV